MASVPAHANLKGGDGLTFASAWLRSRPIFPGLLMREDDVDAGQMIEAAVEERREFVEAQEAARREGTGAPSAAGSGRSTGSSPERSSTFTGLGAAGGEPRSSWIRAMTAS